MSDDFDISPEDLAARAAWLSFVGEMTQDQIAQELGISRQRAQRLVARAYAEGLVKVRIEHPVAQCLELERQLRNRFGLSKARVAPGLGERGEPLRAISPYAAHEFEQIFQDPAAKIIAFGTGRTLRAVIDQMQSVDGGHHKVVSVIGNVAPDGSASFYEVIMRIADKTNAPHYPMAVPVLARNDEEFALYRSLPHVQNTIALADQADVAIMGIGQMNENAPLLLDGFITRDELDELRKAGAVGEIGGHIFDQNGHYLDHRINDRMLGVRVPINESPVLCVGGGEQKIAPLKCALKGKLITSLITDETTAIEILR